MQLKGHMFPDVSTLTTPLLQKQVLQTLREHVVVSFKTLSNKNRHICRIMNQNSALANSTQNKLAINTNHSRSTILTDANHPGSTAEQTIIEHTNPDAKTDERQLVTKYYGKTYPTILTNSFIRQWVD